jgi:hypothetical protein
MYNGFALPAYRGKRYHAIGMAAALRDFTAEGHAGLVSYVNAVNFASLKSCFRLGYQRFGRIAAVKLAGQWHCGSSPGCQKYDFTLGEQRRFSPIGLGQLLAFAKK